jgi:hypothetical protein
LTGVPGLIVRNAPELMRPARTVRACDESCAPRADGSTGDEVIAEVPHPAIGSIAMMRTREPNSLILNAAEAHVDGCRLSGNVRSACPTLLLDVLRELS